jgi:hypothetical protein
LLLAPPPKEQSRPRLAGARLHALIGRVLSTALKRDFDARGRVRSGRNRIGGDYAFLSQSAGSDLKREEQTARVPPKRFRTGQLSRNTRNARRESTERQESSTIHMSLLHLAAELEGQLLTLACPERGNG